MTESEAIRLLRRASVRRRRRIAALLIGVVLYGLVVQGLSARDGDVPVAGLATLGTVALGGWFFLLRPFALTAARMAAVQHLVRGEVVRIRTGLVTASVPGERPREWGGRRRTARLAPGDEVWLPPVDIGEVTMAVVCVPAGGPPFVVWVDEPAIPSSLR